MMNKSIFFSFGRQGYTREREREQESEREKEEGRVIHILSVDSLLKWPQWAWLVQLSTEVTNDGFSKSKFPLVSHMRHWA